MSLSIKSKVTRTGPKKFLLDSGRGPPIPCNREELTNISRATQFEDKVGYMGSVSHKDVHPNTWEMEKDFVDLVSGDSVAKERVASKVNTWLDSTGVGEPPLLLPRSYRQSCVWTQLKSIMFTNRAVRGFPVGKENKGYCIAVAGHIAILPFRPRIRL